MTAPIPHTWDIPEELRRRVGASVGKQRLIAEQGHLLLMLHDLPNAKDPSRREARVFWRKPDGTWRSSSRERDTSIAPLRAHVERFHEAMEALEERVEAADSADDWFSVLFELGPLMRTSRNLSRVLQELREKAGHNADIIAIRDRATDIERAAELVHQWASQGLDHRIARSNEEQARLSEYISRSSHRLNLLAALTFPLTALGAFFGVNLRSGLEELGAPYAFWIFGAVSLALGLAVRSSMPDPPPVVAPVLEGEPKSRG